MRRKWGKSRDVTQERWGQSGSGRTRVNFCLQRQLTCTLSRFSALCFCQRLYSEKYLNSVHRLWREEARARAPFLLCKPVLHVSLVSHHTSLPFLPLSCTLPCPFYTARYLRFDKLEIAAPATLMVLTLLVKRWTRVAANDAPNINGRTCTRATLCWLFFSSLWLSALVWFRLVSCAVNEQN